MKIALEQEQQQIYADCTSYYCYRRQRCSPNHRAAIDHSRRASSNGNERVRYGAGGAAYPHQRPAASSLRVCRLMHKQLVTPSSRDKLLQTSLRKKKYCLGLGKRSGQRPRHAVRRTLPDYFPKRLSKPSLGTNSKFRKLTEEVGADLDRNDPIRVVSEERKAFDQASEISTGSGKVEVSAEQVGEVVKKEVCDEEGPVVLVEEEPVDQKDSIGNFKQNFREYCSVRWKFQIVLSMLQERLEELESGHESSIGNDSAGAADLLEEEGREGMSAVNQASNDRTEESVSVNRTPNPASVPTEEGAVSTGLPDEGSSEPDKENYAPSSPDAEHASNSSALLNGTPASNPEENLLVKPPGYSLLETSKSEILEPTYTCDIELEPLEGRKASFVDSLLNKFNLEPPVMPPVNGSSGADVGDDGTQQQRRCLRDRTKIAARPRYIEIPEEPRRARVSKVFGKLHKTINLDEFDSTNSNSSTEFYGFDEGEVVKLDKPSLPGLLPTPIVKKSQPYAPFLAYGTSIADALSGCDDGASTSITSSKSTVSDGSGTGNELFREEGLIAFGSLPPRLECPRRPNDMVRPRTVAQKRILLQKENDVRYLIIDNESKIFHFLEKRSKNIDAELDFCRMKQLQDQQIPFTRDTWRALAWLRTQKGLYYFQTHTIDGRTVKLTGCAGNHSSKRLTRKNVFSSAVNASGGHKIHYITHCRCPEYPDGVDLDLSAMEPPASEEEQWVAKSRPKLLPSDAWVRSADYRLQPCFPDTKPGPLSSKPSSRVAYEDDPYLGPLEIFHMPTAELEVFPKINRPLDGYVKPFLKMILPHSGITENWARFAVSTLRSARTGDGPDDDERSFVFELPYANDARKLLVRRRLVARPGEELTVACRAKTEVKGVTDLEHFERVLAERLSFREAIDQALERGETVDADERICADIVTELTNSVAITVAEDMFVAHDPDAVSPAGPQQEQPATTAKPLSVDTDCATATSHPALPLSSSSASPRAAAAPSEGTDGKSAEGTASKAANDTAKLKLLREMKRLNATIIESSSHAPPPTGNAATGESQQQQQPCDPTYCALGCICDILGRSEQISSASSAIASSLRRLHCKEAACVLGCVCGYEQKSVNHTQQVQTQGDMKGSVDGSSALTSADVKYLREKATARLAKVERDFAPTVILTDNATVLVRNTESETRRQKKKPKKYDDYYNENSMQILLRGGTAQSLKELESQHSTEATAPPPVEPLPLSERVRHAHVLLTNLSELSALEPWCMVHELYRCYCGGTATHGKSFSFYEENCVPLPAASKGVSKSETSTAPTIASRMMSSNKVVPDVPVAIPSGSSVYGVPRKRLYSFEKVSPTAGGAESVPSRAYAWTTPTRPSASTVASAGRASFRKRDSSEESYRPASEWKQSKRKGKAADDGSGAAVSGAIAYRRNSTIAKRRFSMAVTGGKGLDRDLAQAAIAGSSSTKPVARRSDPHTRSDAVASVSDAQYKIIPRSTPKSTGISNIVLKRIPPAPDTAPVNRNAAKPVKTSAPAAKVVLSEMPMSVVISDSSDESSPECDPPSRVLVSGNKTKGLSTDGAAHVSAAVITKVLSVQGLKHLIHREHQHGTLVPAGKSRIQYVHLVDSNENVQNHVKYRILLDKSKRLIICGDHKSFVDARASSRKEVLKRLAPYSQVMVYIVQMLPNTKATTSSVRQTAPKTMPSASGSTSRTKQFVRPKGTDGSGTVHGGAAVAAGTDQKAPIATSSCDLVQHQPNDPQVASLIRHIRTLLMRTTLHINMVKSGILHMCRWPALLNAFALGQADVLDVTFASGERQTVITTDHSADMLFHQHVQSSFSARRSRFGARSAGEPQQRSLLMELVLKQADSVRMNKDLGLVLYGGEHCWLFCGFLDMNGNSAAEASDSAPRATLPTLPVACSSAKSSSSKPQGNKITEASLSKTFLLSGPTNLHIINATAVSNAAPASDDLDLRIKCRWLKLTIANDFSDMYIPSWQCSVSYAQIRNAIAVANEGRTVFCLKCTNHSSKINTSSPRIYAVPYQSYTVYMGPYPLSQKTVDIVLYQSVDGKMYTREDYERRNGIICDTKHRTTGRWIEMKENAIDTLQRGLERSKVDRNSRNKDSRGSKSSVVETAPVQSAPPTTPAKPITGSSANNRSLLKRSFTNGPSSDSTTCNGGVNESSTNSSVPSVANYEGGSSRSNNKDSIVILEDENNTAEEAGQSSTNPLAASTAISGDGEEGTQNGKRRRLSSVITAELTDDGADRLLKLLEKTMQHTRQEKQKVELMIKSSQAKGGETAQSFAAPLVDRKRKTERESEEQTVPAALHKQRRLSLRPSIDARLETTARPAAVEIVPSGLRRNAPSRISLPNPVPLAKPSEKLPVEHANAPKANVGDATSPTVVPPNGATAKTVGTGSGGLKVRSMESLRIRPAESLAPATNASSAKANDEEVVCLDDDDDDGGGDGTPINDVPANEVRNTPVVGDVGRSNRPQMVLSQQQAALIASKLNLKSGGDQQLGFKFNPTNGVVAMKRSLIQSITQSSQQLLGGAGGKQSQGPRGATATPFTAASLAALRRQSVAVCTSTPTTSTSKALPAPPPTFGAPNETTLRSSEPDQSFASGLVCLTEIQEARLLTKRHVKGVLKSNIPNLGLVEVVRMRNQADIIIRMRELTAQKQYVSVPTFVSATILLNEFIQKNTYTFMPFSLHIKWIFEERSTPLPVQENLTSIINRRSVVTPQGIVDLSKPDLLQSLQTTMPEACDDLMLRRLAMLCYPKELYEKHKCYDNEDKVFTRATEVISTLKQSTQAKELELCFYKKMLKKNEEKLKRLQEPQAQHQQQRRDSVSTYGNRSADGGDGNSTVTSPKQNHNNGNQGGVIVIEDD